MHIPDDKLQEVRDATDILDVVSDHVRLKKSGANFFGLCPFHSEKSPSFSVNPSLGIYKCFGCGAGGDAFQFIMQVEHIPFPEAVRMLADRAGIHLPEEGDPSEDATETDLIFHAIRIAARFYYDSLTQSREGEEARQYLARRAITEASIKKFGIGVSPQGWQNLIDHAATKDVKPGTLEKAGLVIPRNSGDGYYDRFRGRLMFPIFSATGKVVGFGGRILEADEKQPKYINSPETAVYHKSQVLYGLYQARRAIRASREVYVVEGYTDVIAMQQNGIENVVAACGTSLTPDHIRILKRYADAVVFLNDSDVAGDASNRRSIDLALDQHMTPYVVELPDGEDPASFVEQHGGDAFRAYLTKPRYKWSFVQYHLIRARQDGTLDSVEGERKAFEEVLERVSRLESRFEQDAYLHQMAQALDKPVIHLHEEFARVRKRAGKRRQEAPSEGHPSRHEAVESPRAEEMLSTAALPEEEILVRLMLEQGPSMVEYILSNMGLDEFSEGVVQRTITQIISDYEQGQLSRDAYVSGLHGAAVQALVTRVMMDRYHPSENWLKLKSIKVPRFNEEPYETAASAMTLLKLDRIDASLKRTGERLKRVEASGGDVRGVMEEMIALRKLRKQVERREFLDWNDA
jgi:DNA primase